MAPDPFVALMRRYVVDYTNSHDLSVCDEIMEPDYVLRMGPHVLAGRDEVYKPATVRQLEQFPGLGLTVHEVVTSGDRLALRFSEHGASVRHDGAVAAWGGIGLYEWNGSRLTGNRVEQDYLARRRQLADGVPDPVAPPAPAPWDTVATPPDPDVEDAARRWAGAGLPTVSGVVFDDGRDDTLLVEPDGVVVDDVFSAGRHSALHVTVRGRYRGGLDDLDDRIGAAAVLHANALVVVADGRVTGGHVVRDRLGLARALAAMEPAEPATAPATARSAP